ncbi:MAG TPA: hypothetical protein VN903_00775, partial [Polyangia bacterium]|nr:hypothetical protein [Polyangia bacterium]
CPGFCAPGQVYCGGLCMLTCPGSGGATGTAGRGGATGTAGASGTAGAGGTQPARCTAPTDCSGTLTGTTFCPAPTWSCLDGACVAECMGGRTCTEAPDSGCLLCRTPTTTMSQGCVGTQCVFSFSMISQMEQSSGCDASNTPNFQTWQCTGRWAVLPGASRTACTIQNVATDAIRYSVSCGSCVTVVTINSLP